MGSFVLIKQYMCSIGLLWNFNRSKHFNIFLNCATLIFNMIFSVTTLWFVAFTATNFDEYTTGLYYLNCSVLMFWWYSGYLSHRSQFVELFTKIDEIIVKSELNFIKNRFSLFYNILLIFFVFHSKQEVKIALLKLFIKKQMEKLKIQLKKCKICWF